MAKITSSHEKSNNVVETGCLYFGGHDFADQDVADDDAANEDVATAGDDDDEAGLSLKCENHDAVGSDGGEGLGVGGGKVPRGGLWHNAAGRET